MQFNFDAQRNLQDQSGSSACRVVVVGRRRRQTHGSATSGAGTSRELQKMTDRDVCFKRDRLQAKIISLCCPNVFGGGCAGSAVLVTSCGADENALQTLHVPARDRNY